MPGRTPTRPWLHWYGRAAWVRKSKQQLQTQPLCEMCLNMGIIEPATVCDHVEPHHGDPNKFWTGALQSLCWPHHSRAKTFEETHGYSNEIGADGFPVDERHPFNKVSAAQEVRQSKRAQRR